MGLQPIRSIVSNTSTSSGGMVGLPMLVASSSSSSIRLFGSLLLILSFMCVGTLSDMGKMSSPQNHFGITMQSQFTTKNNTRVIAQKGGLAVLPCVVKVNSPATVSWIRRKDFQLLTVGLSTHSSDKRFLVEHTRHMGHWSLRIKSVREDDRGFYECQLSIYPTQSIFIELKVVEAVAEITGAPDLHIDEGSMLRLECKLKRATENPAFVFWYHDSKMVNYDSQNGFSVTSVPGSGALTSFGQIAMQSPTQSVIAPGGDANLGRIGHSLIAHEDSRNDGGNNGGSAGGVSSGTRITNGKSSSGSGGSITKGNGNVGNGIIAGNSNYNGGGSGAGSGPKFMALTSNAMSTSAVVEPLTSVGNVGGSGSGSFAAMLPHNAAGGPLIVPQQQSAYLATPSTSILTIREVHFHHGGNYTCAPSNARSASITVHVLRGERPAAMQHSNRSLLDGGSGSGDMERTNNTYGGIGAGQSSGAASWGGSNHLLNSLRALVRFSKGGTTGNGGGGRSHDHKRHTANGYAYYVGCLWWCCCWWHGSLVALAAIAFKAHGYLHHHHYRHHHQQQQQQQQKQQQQKQQLHYRHSLSASTKKMAKDLKNTEEFMLQRPSQNRPLFIFLLLLLATTIAVTLLALLLPHDPSSNWGWCWWSLPLVLLWTGTLFVGRAAPTTRIYPSKVHR